MSKWDKKIIRIDTEPAVLPIELLNSFGDVSKWNQLKLCLDVLRDIADAVQTNRPALPQETVFPHDAAFVSETAAAKLARVRAAMKEQGAAWHLISSLDDTAWLTNLRGSDVPYNPVFLSYLLIGTDSAVLFVDEAKLNPASRVLLAEAGITTALYAAVREALVGISNGPPYL